MQQLIPILALTVITIGLTASILGLKEFTDMLGESDRMNSSPKESDTGPKPRRKPEVENDTDFAAAA